MTDEELKALVASLAISQAKTDEQMRKTDEQMRKTDEQINRLEKQVEKMAKKIDHVGNIVDGVSKNQGAVAEEFFFNSLIDNPHLGEIHFDDVAKNGHKHRGKIEEEYDIVMTNGNAIGIIEVKYKAHENDLDKLERKMRHFKMLYPWFEQYKLYGAIASFHIYDEAKKAALKRGFFVLQRSGKVVHTDCSENLLVL